MNPEARDVVQTKPFDKCYWVIPGKFLAGEYPRNWDDESSREKLASICRAGVSVFVDLTEADEGLKPYAQLLEGPSHERFPIPDLSTPSSAQHTRSILDAIDGHLDAGRVVYLHCWGGIGRTGTIVGCWLARHHGVGQAALDRLKELWQDNPKSLYTSSPETPHQRRYVREWREEKS